MSEIRIDLNDDPQLLLLLSQFLAEWSGDRVEEGTNPPVLAPQPTPIQPEAPAVEPTPEPEPAGIVEHAQTESPSAPVEVDKTGRPWDKRIHAVNQSKNADGTWRKRRGVDKDLYDQVMAEIVPAATPAPPPPPAQPELSPAQPELSPAKAFGAAQPAQSATSSTTWPELMTKMVGKKKEGGYDPVKENAFLTYHQLGGIVFLAQRPDLWDSFTQEMGL